MKENNILKIIFNSSEAKQYVKYVLILGLLSIVAFTINGLKTNSKSLLSSTELFV